MDIKRTLVKAKFKYHSLMEVEPLSKEFLLELAEKNKALESYKKDYYKLIYIYDENVRYPHLSTNKVTVEQAVVHLVGIWLELEQRLDRDGYSFELHVPREALSLLRPSTSTLKLPLWEYGTTWLLGRNRKFVQQTIYRKFNIIPGLSTE